MSEKKGLRFSDWKQSCELIKYYAQEICVLTGPCFRTVKNLKSRVRLDTAIRNIVSCCEIDLSLIKMQEVINENQESQKGDDDAA